MASSTFSSSCAAPPRSLFALLGGLTVAAVLAGAAELAVRSSGLDALTVHDTDERWLQQRERAARLGSRGVVLLGASRIQAGIDLQTLRRHAGVPVVQLGLSANPVLPVLESISRDEGVTGLVVVSLTAESLYEFSRDTRSDVLARLHEERRRGSLVAYAPLERWLRGLADASLVSRAAGFHPLMLLDGAGGSARYVRTLPDRSQKMDYSRVDRERAYRERLAKIVGTGQIVRQIHPDFEQRVAGLNALIRRIQARGGRVVLVRFPSSRGVWQVEETRYPKAEYWDRLARLTDAETIHFMDHPSLAGYDLPDGVHLDQAETEAFTAALARLLPLEKAGGAAGAHESPLQVGWQKQPGR